MSDNTNIFYESNNKSFNESDFEQSDGFFSDFTIKITANYKVKIIQITVNLKMINLHHYLHVIGK